MQTQTTHMGDEDVDRTTGAAIRHAIGERLRRDFEPEDGVLPTRLQMLLDEMQRQDADQRP